MHTLKQPQVEKVERWIKSVDGASDIILTPDSKKFVLVKESSLEFYDIQTKNKESEIEYPGEDNMSTYGLVFTPDMEYLVGKSDKKLKIFGLKTKTVEEIEVEERIGTFTLSRDGQFIIIIIIDWRDQLSIWDFESKIRLYSTDLCSTHTVLVTPNDQYIVAAEDDSINIFPLKPIKESKELQEKLNKLRQSRNQFDKERISSDCHRIISSMNFKKVDIFYEDYRITSLRTVITS